MEDHPGGDAMEGLFVGVEIFVEIAEADLFGAVYVFPDLGYAEAAFIIRPFVSFCCSLVGVDEHLLYAMIAGKKCVLWRNFP